MPGPNLHLCLAEGLLVRLKGTTYANSIDRDYLYLGALGPDIGVFPGCYSLLSNLAHYHLTGSLAGAFLRNANCSNTFSYAVGWLSHFYADCLIHPLVNRAVGELIYGDNSREVSYHDSPQDHFLIEIGLDACFSADFNGHPGKDKLSTLPSFMAEVYEQCYGVTLPPETFYTSNCLSHKYSRILSEMAFIHHSRFYKVRLPNHTLTTYAARYIPGLLLSALLGRRFQYFGIVNALKPESWLIEEVKIAADTVIEEVLRVLAEPDRSLPELNLDNGKDLEGDESQSVKDTVAELNSLINAGHQS